jgi:hypothetical protein
VIQINENQNSYLLDVKYFSSKFLLLNNKKSLFLDNLKNNKIFQSIKDNPQLMSRYGFKDSFIYAKVRTNYINGSITELQ